MLKNDRQRLLHELETAEAVVAVGGMDPLEALNAKNMVLSIRDQIENEDQRPVRRAQIKLGFRGAPVFDTRGVDADFGMKATDPFQRAIHKRASALCRRAKIAPPPSMAIVDVTRESFGFLLEEMPRTDGQQIGNTNLKQATEEVQEVFSLAVQGEESPFLDRLKRLDAATRNAIREFIEVVDDAAATFHTVSEEREVIFSEKDVSATANWVKKVEFADEEESILGVFKGFLPISRQFEFIPIRGGIPIHGKVSDDVRIDDLEAYRNRECIVVILTKKKKRSAGGAAGRSQAWLIGIHPPPPSAPLMVPED